jgi:hypothetical protein
VCVTSSYLGNKLKKVQNCLLCIGNFYFYRKLVLALKITCLSEKLSIVSQTTPFEDGYFGLTSFFVELHLLWETASQVWNTARVHCLNRSCALSCLPNNMYPMSKTSVCGFAKKNVLLLCKSTAWVRCRVNFLKNLRKKVCISPPPVINNLPSRKQLHPRTPARC